MPKIKADLLITNLREVVTCDLGLNRPHRQSEMSQLNLIPNGAIGIQGENLVFVGSTETAQKEVESSETLSSPECVVLPGFVDSHTHPVFHGSRELEFEQRIQGKSYVEIAQAGGGIRNSVRRLRQASFEELYDSARKRLNRLLSFGVTTIEAKSGYGLSVVDEIKMLQVLQKLKAEHPLDIFPTFLGAHEFPDEYRENREGYVQLILQEMLPEVVRQKLAVFCDVFCEDHVFTLEQSRRILLKAKELGLEIKMHADEIKAIGGAELAAEVSAVSADHLIAVSDHGISAMIEKGVMGTLLPATCFHLGLQKYAPARKMIEQGLAVALATDLNPGTSMTESMPMVLTLACLQYKMTSAEAITASTINGAHAVRYADRVGSLRVGKQADFVLWNIPSYRYLPYHFGVNLAQSVYKKGKKVFSQGEVLR